MTLLLDQEAVKRKNQQARGHSTLLLTKKESHCTLNTAAFPELPKMSEVPTGSSYVPV